MSTLVVLIKNFKHTGFPTKEQFHACVCVYVCNMNKTLIVFLVVSKETAQNDVRFVLLLLLLTSAHTPFVFMDFEETTKYAKV